MIVELHVENLAIIERCHLTLGPGFTVLTGETGAGKSLLIDAIELALGERADTDLVRSGEQRATVHVVLDLKDRPNALAACAELGITLDESRLTIQREIVVEGRSQCRIGGKVSPVSTLKQLGAFLIDLHGQHDHQSLLDPERHVEFLDAWIGGPVLEIKQEIEGAFKEATEARRRLHAFRNGLRDREHRLDLLKFQITEIETISPRIGELDELTGQVSRLKHVEKLAETSFGVLSALADDDPCVLDRLGFATKELDSALRFDPSLETIASQLREAFVVVDEASHRLRSYAEALEADPAILDQFTERIDSLKRLQRKYGSKESEILEFLDRAKEEFLLLEDVVGGEEELSATLDLAEKGLSHAAGQLTSLRKERSKEFADRVQTQLRDLAMDRAIFMVNFHERAVDASGADDVQFYFSANVGESPRPLSRIASGGEISRVMLAIKTAMAGRAGVPTLVFDEVDAGLGGRAAVTVARKLGELACHYQVLVISHLPQIAARADHHLRIEKTEDHGRVVTTVRSLDVAERIDEIARMLAGEEVTETVMANAREMLQS